jgi:hypothetical protein
MGIKRSLTTAYHPQADGQTEIMNQTLEVALRAFIGPTRNDWIELLDGFKLAYNTSVHASTGFTPSYLLYGFEPKGKTNFITPGSESIREPFEGQGSLSPQAKNSSAAIKLAPRAQTEADSGISARNTEKETPRHRRVDPRKDSPGINVPPSESGWPRMDKAPDELSSDFRGWSVLADRMIDSFVAIRSQARDSLILAQNFQCRNYNNGRLNKQFEVGDKVMLDVHALRLLRDSTGLGKKLLPRYDGPFEIQEKISRVAYRLRMPASFGIHPVLNIEHLEVYNTSPDDLGTRPTKNLSRDDFEVLPEYEIEAILGEKWGKTRGGKRQKLYRVRFSGYSPNYDEWLPRRNLKNAPEILRDWESRRRSQQ